MNWNGLEWVGMTKRLILTGISSGLEWVGMNRNELEWVGMTWNGCNDIKADFDRNFNRIGMGWNELE